MEHPHPPREMACGSSARRCSCALLILAVASLLNACGGGPSVGPSLSATASIPAGPTLPTAATLTWDAEATPPTGYRIYYGTASGTYSQPFGQGLDVGNVTTHTVTGLKGGTRYYFAATAFDTNGESAPSNEVFKDVP